MRAALQYREVARSRGCQPQDTGFFDKLTKLIVRETVRDVTCFSCGHRQTVAGAAQSTLCPQCGSYVDLKDFKIDGPFGRSILTQGDVVILQKGDCSGARIACATARLEGKVRGHLVATNEVRVRTKEKVIGAIETRNLIIEKKCDCEFVRPIKADNVEISGRISARIVCTGKVTINKGGALEGILYAKSIVVEKGGIFSGELCIRQNPKEEIEKLEQGTLFGGESGTQLSPA